MSHFPAPQPHGGMKKIFSDAYWVTGTAQLKPMVRLIRNMVILRHGTELTLVNAVRLDAEGEAALDKLGTVKHVLKIGSHGMDDAYYIDRYGAQHWTVHPAESPDSTELTEDTQLPIPETQLFWFKDTLRAEAAILVEREGGLLITCDSIQHWAPHRLMSLGARFVTWILGFQNPAQIGPPWLRMQSPKGGSLKADFERLARLPFNHIIGAHGGLLMHEAPARFAETMKRVFG